MTQNAETHDQAAGAENPSEPAAPITSRFLFVDVAAQRAKQLRRGALARLDRPLPSAGPHKLERIAMEEVRNGLTHSTLPSADVMRRAKACWTG
jgi:DNA-directed RNA polymerase subunit K/omega